MRWKALFEDMEAQFDAAERLADDVEIADRVRGEQGAVTFADRLRGQLGLVLRVGTTASEVFKGELAHLGAEWLVLSKAPKEVIIPMASIRYVEGLGRNVAAEGSRVHGALGLGSALRTLARDRAAVTVHTVEAEARIEGFIDRVGRDFMEIAAVLPGEPRRSARVSAVYAVPFTAISAVSSRQ